ncbi:MAG TPA: ferrochelatase [Thermohalobaculum sp.]|nr:ferrochelatase [Thermohalobaculum sp.]
MLDAPRTDIPGHGRLTHAPKDHPRVPAARVGVLLANLGTPDGTDYWSMRRYLNEFLSDRRVIEWPVAIWQPVLQGIVLTRRPFSSGEAYRGIWNEALDESPLLTITRSQTAKLRARLEARFGAGVLVDFCMRYGNPSTDTAIRRLKEQGAERIVFFPLYPQYAAPTTATANDQAFRTLMRMRWQPAVRTVPAYHDHPAYVAALAGSVERAYGGLDARPEVLVTSYHGLPQSYFAKGDPYHCHCQKTTRLLAERLGWAEGAIHTTFQSRFGPEEWLQPYTVEHVAELARQGKKRIAVMAPGFASDCVETLEEIQEEIRDAFLEAGGEHFHYIPCLNDDDAHIDMLEEIVLAEGAGWLDAGAGAEVRAAAE